MKRTLVCAPLNRFLSAGSGLRRTDNFRRQSRASTPVAGQNLIQRVVYRTSCPIGAADDDPPGRDPALQPQRCTRLRWWRCRVPRSIARARIALPISSGCDGKVLMEERYFRHYHRSRCHLSLVGDAPEPRCECCGGDKIVACAVECLLEFIAETGFDSL